MLATAAQWLLIVSLSFSALLLLGALALFFRARRRERRTIKRIRRAW